MSIKIPPEVRNQIIGHVDELADRHKYLQKGKNANAVFIDALVADPHVGRRLREFMPEERVKSYVKDALLNKYAKRRKGLLRDLGGVISADFGKCFEVGYDKERGVSLHRSEANTFIAAARTTYVKWETGLKKLLLYVAGLPDKTRGNGKGDGPRLLLVIHEHGNPVNESDKRLTERALGLVGVDCAWVD
ncbi:MAG: hypothetical protein JOZ96_05525 [Acidobacteria bacterium]|nr:hypothetical protein [Acidobacteriota bacterium]